MQRVRVILFILACASASFAQPNPDTLWTRTYGGSNFEEATSVQQTTDGGYIVAGYTWSFGAGSFDIFLVKTNSQGDTLWTHTYGSGGIDYAWSIQQTTDGGYVVAGQTQRLGAGYFDAYLVKTNSQGDTLWTRTYGGDANDGASSIRPTSDGGYIIAGYTDSFGAGSSDLFLLKTNHLGDTLWTRTYGGTDNDGAGSAQETDDGGYVLAGYTYSFGAGLEDFYLVKTNSQGDTLWTRTYGGDSWDNANCVQQAADGGYVVVGSAKSFGSGDYDFYLVKTNPQGDTLWTRRYGGSDDDHPFSIQQTSDGGYILAGASESFGEGDYDFYLVKTNSQGDILWTRTYGGSERDFCYSALQTLEGGFVMAGHTASFGAGAGDYYLVKTGPELEAESNIIYLPEQFLLHQNCPNPFNPLTTIRYDVSRTGSVSLKVFDLLGQEVASLVQSTITAGSYTLTWDATNFSSGVYLCHMNAGGFVQTRKMILLK